MFDERRECILCIFESLMCWGATRNFVAFIFAGYFIDLLCIRKRWMFRRSFVCLFVCFVRSNSLQLVSVCPSFSFYLHTHLRIYIFIHDAHRLLHRTAALMITAFWWGSTKYSAIVVACIRLKLFRSGTCQLIKLLIHSFKSIHFTRIIESRFFFFHSLHFYFCLIASCVCV